MRRLPESHPASSSSPALSLQIRPGKASTNRPATEPVLCTASRSPHQWVGLMTSYYPSNDCSFGYQNHGASHYSRQVRFTLFFSYCLRTLSRNEHLFQNNGPTKLSIRTGLQMWWPLRARLFTRHVKVWSLAWRISVPSVTLQMLVYSSCPINFSLPLIARIHCKTLSALRRSPRITRSPA